MSARIERHGAVTVVRLSTRRLAGAAADGLPGVVRPHLRSGGRVALDLGEVEAVDGAGLAALLALRDHARVEGGWLRLCAPTPPVRRVLLATALHRRLDLYNDVEEAVASFGGAPAPGGAR